MNITIINITNTRKAQSAFFLLTVFFMLVLSTATCKGPAGPEGPRGQQGPIGSAGDDGSMIYAAEDEPGEDVGDIGDYYLDQNTGEFYGPKDSDGWGNPIIVLMGENGQDGIDGKDGSQIYSGDGAPDSSLGVEGDYYLDQASYKLYGPKTSGGWGMPLNLKGANGNANVTRYLFPSHDFSSPGSGYYHARIPIRDEEEMMQSAWLVYLVGAIPLSTIEEAYWSVPGYGIDRNTYYRSDHYFVGTAPNGQVLVRVLVHSGTGEAYNRVEVIRIEAANTVDLTDTVPTLIPDHLDISDYEAVADYYGFSGNTAK